MRFFLHKLSGGLLYGLLSVALISLNFEGLPPGFSDGVMTLLYVLILIGISWYALRMDHFRWTSLLRAGAIGFLVLCVTYLLVASIHLGRPYFLDMKTVRDFDLMARDLLVLLMHIVVFLIVGTATWSVHRIVKVFRPE